jgi:dipeptidyl aminopeptidase/acylaminoacyl peptidase
LRDPRVYSPDRSHFAYVDHQMLQAAETYGGGSWGVPGNWLGGPSWSPTGDRIAITAHARGGPSPIEVRLLDVATGSMTLVTEADLGSELEVVGFTPRGDRILFTTTDDTGWGLWSIGVDGSDARLIVDGTDGNFYRVSLSPATGAD